MKSSDVKMIVAAVLTVAATTAHEPIPSLMISFSACAFWICSIIENKNEKRK